MTVALSVVGAAPVGGVYKLPAISAGAENTTQFSATYTLPGGEQDQADDPEAHVELDVTWSGPENATFAPPTELNTTLSTAFTTKGLHTFAVTVAITYRPGSGDTSYAGEATVTLSQFVEQKVWSAGSGIGVVLDAQGEPSKDQWNRQIEDGRMTSPQDQRPKPQLPNGEFPVPAPVRAAPGARLGCAVETATDQDHWDKEAENPQQSTKGDEADAVHYKWTCSGGQFYLGDDEEGAPKFASEVLSASATWQAPTSPGNYTVSCAIDDAPTAVALPDAPLDTPTAKAREDAAISRGVSVTVWQAALRVKRKGTPNTKYGTTALVAEGAVPDAAHQADVEVTITDGLGNALPNIAVPGLVVASGGRGPQADTETATLTGFGATDGDGKSFGTFTSGNRAETTTIKLPYDSAAPKTGVGPTATLNQVWNELGDSAWDYPPGFVYDWPDTISYRMQFHDGDAETGEDVPITGHAMEMITTSVSGAQWNPDIGEDWDEDDLPDGEYEDAVYTIDDEDSTGFDTWSALSYFGSVAEDEAGVYSTDQTIWWHDDFIVDSVGFDILDNVAYDINGSEDVE